MFATNVCSFPTTHGHTGTIVHVKHSDGAISEKYWFGLYSGCVTSTWPKLNSNLQKLSACKISGDFVPCPRIQTLLPHFIYLNLEFI